jgi:WD40 repeat protein
MSLSLSLDGIVNSLCITLSAGHPASVDALVKVDEDTLLTGSSDGLIRVVSIHPDKLVGVLGDHHDGFPIEKLQFNSNRDYVGSVTHDNLIRLWDARVLREDYDEDTAVQGSVEPMTFSSQAAAEGRNTGSDDEWQDMDVDKSEDEDSDDSDDSDSDDDKGKAGKNDKRAKRLKNETEKFFDDL